MKAAALVLLLLASGAAHAVLGGDLASIQADALQVQGTRRATAALDHTVHEIVAPDGARQRQYTNAQGRVFRVDWVQDGKPRLAALLGVHDAAYRAALQRAGRGSPLQRQVVVEAGDLVVQQSAYLNRHAGSAWLRSQLPASLAEQRR